MKELIAWLAASLSAHPEKAAVTECAKDNGTLLELQVAAEDLTHLIGKHGRTARAMRSLLSAAGAKNGRRYYLKIMSGDAPGGAEPPDKNPGAPEDAPV